MIVHTRDADDDTIAMLEDEMGKGAFTGLIHCFTGTQRLADAALALGLYISVSGIATFKNSQPLRDVIKTVPLDRLLVETDAPFLAPVPHRGKTNEPAFVVHTAKMLAGTERRQRSRARRRHDGEFLPPVPQSAAARHECRDDSQVRILGCGSSGGVPRLGGPDGAGNWGACDPANPKNRRRRCSILVRRKSVKAKPAFWWTPRPICANSLLAARIGRLDGVLITHDHADQTHGMDDLRAITLNMRQPHRCVERSRQPGKA